MEELPCYLYWKEKITLRSDTNWQKPEDTNWTLSLYPELKLYKAKMVLTKNCVPINQITALKDLVVTLLGQSKPYLALYASIAETQNIFMNTLKEDNGRDLAD